MVSTPSSSATRETPLSKRSCRGFASWLTPRVDQAELVGLLRGGVDAKRGHWADLGAGAHITAVDREAGSLRALADAMGKRFPATQLDVVRADFTRPLALAVLDGIVMANSLHFVRDKRPVLAQVQSMLRPGGRLIVVEYGSDGGNPWVPHPFTYERWEQMAADAGFERTRLLGTVPSRYLGSMYSAITYAPLPTKVD